MSTPQTELPHKPIERIRRSLRKDYDFTEDASAGTVMAVNDAIELVLEDIGQFKSDVNERFDRIENRFDRFESNQRWHLIGIAATIIGVAGSIAATFVVGIYF